MFAQSKLISTILLLMAACSPHRVIDASEAEFDPLINLLKPDQGPAILKQCSRSTPERGSSYFTPTMQDVSAFETALQASLDANPIFLKELEWRKQGGLAAPAQVSKNWARDIVGLHRNGRRFLYGNYYPKRDRPATLSKSPVIICDGGPSFFGAEYDIEYRKITHLKFNGSI
jgi:hypothetical protein